MARKRWTPQTEITDSLLRLREKRKWQLAYRRYVVEQKPSETYASYFGLDIQTLREWFTLQFCEPMSWDNYGKAWQIEHIIPATYFDFQDEKELKLCWSFINMRVQPLDEEGQHSSSFNLLASKTYFTQLQTGTQAKYCTEMLEKLKEIEEKQVEIPETVYSFLTQHQEKIEQIHALTADELDQLNRGTDLKEILLEREILKKFS
jgi:hypothetical protein